MKLDIVPQELMNDFGVDVKYYAGYLCSCHALNHGSYDPKCGCLGGFRYKAPVEYRLIRTSIRYDKLTEKAGQILQGGCLLTVPKFLDKNNAQVTGKVDLSAGINLTINYNLRIGIDGSDPVTINCKTDAISVISVKIQEIIGRINTALGDGIAAETGVDGDLGTGYITIKSLTVGTTSRVRILKPTANDATFQILGLSESRYPFGYNWSNSGKIYLPVYNSLSIGDVFVLKKRYYRDSAICQKGVNDTIKAFDIQGVQSISKGSVIYRQGADYSVAGNVITWITGGTQPENGDFYAVEHLLPIQYIVYNDIGSDRGADDDQPAKKVMVALRNYINAQSLTIDNLGN